MKTKKKPRRPITRLWHVRISYGKEIYGEILVSKGPVRGSHGNPGMIRAKTGKAAGRIFQKSLAWRQAAQHYETENPFGGAHGDVTPEMIKRFKDTAKKAVIRVINEPDC